jgi:hypothetical protein
MAQLEGRFDSGGSSCRKRRGLCHDVGAWSCWAIRVLSDLHDRRHAQGAYNDPEALLQVREREDHHLAESLRSALLGPRRRHPGTVVLLDDVQETVDGVVAAEIQAITYIETQRAVTELAGLLAY